MLGRDKPAIFNRIIFFITIPVILTAVIISTLLIKALSPPVDQFLKDQFESNLRLASNMGQRICQSNFNYLLELRLEDNLEMNQALQNEVLEEVKALSGQMPKIHLMVINGDQELQAWSLPVQQSEWHPPGFELQNDTLVRIEIDERPVLSHIRFFPFWDWYIVSFVFEEDYLSPIKASHNIIYLSMLGVFATVLVTLLITYYYFVDAPLRRLILATRDISQGKYRQVEKIDNNELGQLTSAFNSMIASLKKEKSEVRNLINQLQASESQLRTLFENIPLGICVADGKGRILRTNQAMQSITEESEEQLQGRRLCELFDHCENCRELLLDLGGLKSPKIFETELSTDGVKYSLRVILAAISLDKRRLVFAVIEDVTEQIELEKQLIQVRKMEAIGGLAGGVAHDFNNLLTPIIGYSEILLGDTSPESERYIALRSILDAGMKARGIVRQLLAFSRKQTLEVKTVDLNTIITGFLSLLQRTIREDIQIRQELAPSLPPINADTGQIEQVIMNLAINAQDAMPQGGELTIETETVFLDEAYALSHTSVIAGRYVMMAISDNGHGMDKATIDRIFDPFFTTKAKGRGTGFGLATVYGIVKQHGGNTWVYSEPDKGSTFKVYLPVADESIEPEPEEEKIINKNAGGKTILIVEDDIEVLGMAATILRNQNYHVLSATNGRDALEVCAHHRDEIDLLLTDVIMPEMNGRELYEQISGEVDGMKVVFMSGYTDDVIAHYGIVDPGVVFLQKPFSIKSLTSKVRQALAEP